MEIQVWHCCLCPCLFEKMRREREKEGDPKDSERGIGFGRAVN
jgi:hypothetical protein